MITGTKYPAIRSASRAIGAFEPWALATKAMICESAVWLPIRVARQVNWPTWLTVPALTRSPELLATGKLSPVNIDSSTVVSPAKTIPSTGILWPAWTKKVLPTLSSATGTSLVCPLATTNKAFLGTNVKSEVKAKLVFCFERSSKYLPNMTRAMIVPAAS